MLFCFFAFLQAALCSSAVSIGLHELNCFLPDDPVKLSVIVVRSLAGATDLHKILLEQFNSDNGKPSRGLGRSHSQASFAPSFQAGVDFAGSSQSTNSFCASRGNSSSNLASMDGGASLSRGNSNSSLNHVDPMGSSGGGGNTGGPWGMSRSNSSASMASYASSTGPTLRHSLSNVTFSKHNMGFKLVCLVDDCVEAEVVFNNRNDLCMLAFTDEVDALVGKNHLFKRSILLIRAWWFYETVRFCVLRFCLCAIFVRASLLFFVLIMGRVQAATTKEKRDPLPHALAAFVL